MIKQDVVITSCCNIVLFCRVNEESIYVWWCCGVWYDVAKLYLEKLMLFNAVIEKDENGYFAHIPELKGCMTQGSTYEEALINIKEAAELYLESLEIEEVKSFQNRLFSITPIEVNYHAHLS